jgi:hypothetical protein
MTGDIMPRMLMVYGTLLMLASSSASTRKGEFFRVRVVSARPGAEVTIRIGWKAGTRDDRVKVFLDQTALTKYFPRDTAPARYGMADTITVKTPFSFTAFLKSGPAEVRALSGDSIIVETWRANFGDHVKSQGRAFRVELKGREPKLVPVR